MDTGQTVITTVICTFVAMILLATAFDIRPAYMHEFVNACKYENAKVFGDACIKIGADGTTAVVLFRKESNGQIKK